MRRNEGERQTRHKLVFCLIFGLESNTGRTSDDDEQQRRQENRISDDASVHHGEISNEGSFLSSNLTYLCTLEAARRLDRVKVEDNMVTEVYSDDESS